MEKHQIGPKNTVFPQKSILENCSYSETTWNFKEQFEVPKVKTSNIIFIIILDHQAAHIYKYMGQSIFKTLGFFEAKQNMPQRPKLWDWGRSVDY